MRAATEESEEIGQVEEREIVDEERGGEHA